LRKSCWEGWLAGLHNLRAQQAVREDCTISGGKVGFPLEMRNLQGEVNQPAIGPSPGEQLVKGKDQTLINMLPLRKKDTEA